MKKSHKEKDLSSYEKLLLILKIILNHLNIIKLENIGNFSDGIKNLKEFKLSTDINENNLNLFIHFLQRLFLDEKKEFDFDLQKLTNILEKKTIEKIFTELIYGIEDHDFFNFLKNIGSIFTSIYFIDPKVGDFLNDDINKCKNAYECILFILFSCKGKFEGQWFIGIYREYFQLKYEDELIYRIILSTRNHFNLLYGEEYFESSDDEKIEESEEEEKTMNDDKEEEKEDKEDIISSIRFDFFEFFCHAFLFYEKEL